LKEHSIVRKLHCKKRVEALNFRGSHRTVRIITFILFLPSKFASIFSLRGSDLTSNGIPCFSNFGGWGGVGSLIAPIMVLTIALSFGITDESRYRCRQFRFWTDSEFRIDPFGTVPIGDWTETLTRLLLLPGSSSVKSIIVFVGRGRFCPLVGDVFWTVGIGAGARWGGVLRFGGVDRLVRLMVRGTAICGVWVMVFGDRLVTMFWILPLLPFTNYDRNCLKVYSENWKKSEDLKNRRFEKNAEDLES